jgi:hypothetical protein
MIDPSGEASLAGQLTKISVVSVLAGIVGGVSVESVTQSNQRLIVVHINPATASQNQQFEKRLISSLLEDEEEEDFERSLQEALPLIQVRFKKGFVGSSTAGAALDGEFHINVKYDPNNGQVGDNTGATVVMGDRARETVDSRGPLDDDEFRDLMVNILRHESFHVFTRELSFGPSPVAELFTVADHNPSSLIMVSQPSSRTLIKDPTTGAPFDKIDIERLRAKFNQQTD